MSSEFLKQIREHKYNYNSKLFKEKKLIRFTETEEIRGRVYRAMNLDSQLDRVDYLSDQVLKYLFHALTDGYTLNANVHIKLITGNEQQSTKSFVVFKLSDIKSFKGQLEQYNFNMQANSPDYTTTVRKIIINVIKEQGGGCNSTGKKKSYRIGTTQFSQERTTIGENNCFFYEVSKHLNVKRLSKKFLNTIRKDFELKENDFIPISVALKIYKKYKTKDAPPLGIIDSSFKIYGNKDGFMLSLDGGHYATPTKIEISQCPDCLTEYIHKHKCNPKKVEYVNIKIRKKRELICVSKPDDFLINDSVLHYDLESCPNKHYEHEPYIVGMVYKGEYKTFAGVDCMERFVDYLLTIKEKVYVNAYNGSNFDHYFIYRTFLDRELKPEKDIINNGSIIKFKYKEINLFDMCKHLTGSLKKNLSDFGCKVQKGDFDHDLATPWEVMSVELKEQCLKYLEGDVLGLQELFEKVNTLVYEEHNVNLTTFISASALTFSLWKKNIAGKFNISLPTMEHEKDFRQAVYGARTYPSKSKFESEDYQKVLDKTVEFDDIDDYVIDADVVSLYPAAMAKYPYPVGHPIKTYKYVPDKLGIYKVKVKTSSNNQHSLAPRRIKNALRWDGNNDGVRWYSTVDIDMILSNGGTVKFICGWYWKKSEYIYKEYVEKLFQRKADSTKGTAPYLLAKLYMNALYGKNIQRPIVEQTKKIIGHKGYWDFYGSHDITDLTKIDGKDIWFISGIPREQDKQEASISKPTHLGVFILSYSKKIMTEYMKEANPYFNSHDVEKRIENDFYYTDTDSLQMHQTHAHRMKRLGDATLGGMTDDLGGCKIIRGIWISPKLYYLEYIKEDMKIHYHFRGKGLNAKDLSRDVFERMHHGESYENVREFSMKKINYKRNSKQKDKRQFSIGHLSSNIPEQKSRLTRTVNNNKWNGRKFTGNVSVPHM